MNGSLMVHRVKKITLGNADPDNSYARTLTITFENDEGFSITMFSNTEEGTQLKIVEEKTI